MSILGVFLFASTLHYFLKNIIGDKERSRLAGHLYDGILILFYRNIFPLSLLAFLLLTFFYNQVPMANVQLLLNIYIVWLFFRMLLQLARLVLLEQVRDSSGQDVKFYYHLKWLLVAGGTATLLMVFSHQLPLSLLLQDLFTRLFMLFLLALSGVLWKSRETIPYLLHSYLKNSKKYLRNTVYLLTILIPLILFTTALIGLLGYTSLAWNLSGYQAHLLLLLTSYVIVRGLLIDGLELLSLLMINQLHNGWLWIEVILKPIDKMLRILLLLITLVVLLEILGSYSFETLMAHLVLWGQYTFINVAGIHITAKSTFEFFILVFLFTWLAKWTREFCYRWLFRHTSDVGIRNSLSVFTQYAVVLVGAFVTLRVLGLDFSGLSMVLGGLAVGMVLVLEILQVTL